MLPYCLTIFIGAFLLFQIQPMIGKYILPWFGGTPAVWTTCMLFFQLLLLIGYTYAHMLNSRLRPRMQGFLQVVVLLVSLILLAWQAMSWKAPLLPPGDFKPDDPAQPVWHILAILAVAVGLVYFMLATTSPLIQAWFHRSHPGRSPYRLYCLSNAGSLLALVSYPFAVEQALSLSNQALVWSGLFLLFILGYGYCSLKVIRNTITIEPAPAGAGAIEAERPGWGRYALWLGLTACASAMLLAATNQMCQDVAVIPFLWVLPLTLYLLSFILTFGSERWYSRRVFGPAMVVMTVMTISMLYRYSTNVLIQIPIYSLSLFVCCMICHGELVRLKPHPRHLTGFYLTVSLGGALGGVFVGLLAPLLFDAYWEMHLSLFGCLAMFWWLLLRDRDSWLHRGRVIIRQVATACLLLGLGLALLLQTQKYLCLSLVSTRNFYGVLRVEDINRSDPKLHRYSLRHGLICHGMQFDNPADRRIPTTYFGQDTGLGRVFELHPRCRTDSPEQGCLRIGVLGLGIGTIAAYGQAGDTIRFYEINPQVVDLAQGKGGYFSYLSDGQARIEVVLGDARISLERELKQGELGRFDILVVDVFSSDAIPVHLLTVEAFEVYLQHLKSDGIIAFHVSNNYLDLGSVVVRLALHFEFPSFKIDSEQQYPYSFPSRWILITRNQLFLKHPEFADKVIWPSPDQVEFPVSLWTDDFSNVFEIVWW